MIIKCYIYLQENRFQRNSEGLLQIIQRHASRGIECVLFSSFKEKLFSFNTCLLFYQPHNLIQSGRTILLGPLSAHLILERVDFCDLYFLYVDYFVQGWLSWWEVENKVIEEEGLDNQIKSGKISDLNLHLSFFAFA